MYVCMYVCMYLYIHIHIYIYTYTHTHICMSLFKHTHIYTIQYRINMSIHIYLHRLAEGLTRERECGAFYILPKSRSVCSAAFRHHWNPLSKVCDAGWVTTFHTQSEHVRPKLEKYIARRVWHASWQRCSRAGSVPADLWTEEDVRGLWNVRTRVSRVVLRKSRVCR